MSTVNDTLEHIGVKGMKWGHRKAAGPAPDKKFGKSAYLTQRRASAYSNPAARAQRQLAGKQALATVLTTYGTRLASAAIRSRSPQAAAVISTVGGLSASALGIRSNINNIQSIHKERVARGLAGGK